MGESSSGYSISASFGKFNATKSTIFVSSVVIKSTYTTTNLSSAKLAPGKVDTAINMYALPRSGGTMTGELTLSGDPTSAMHAATKQYVDANKAVTYTATVTETWTADGDYFYQDIVVDGIQTTDEPLVDIVPAEDNATTVANAEAFANVFRVTTSDGSIRVWSKEAVATAFSIKLKVVY